MTFPIKSMAIVRYFKDRSGSETALVKNPSWTEVERAIRQMDNYYFPIVLLSCIEFDSGEEVFGDEDSLNLIGAADGCAIFHMMAEWQYEDPKGDDSDVRLWESDQGYFCKEYNVLRDTETVLKIVNKFYTSGSYDELDAIEFDTNNTLHADGDPDVLHPRR